MSMHLSTDAPTSPASGNFHAASYETMGTTGDLIIVTEPVTTLRAWLEKPHEHKLERLAWGLVCIVKALDFLSINAKMTHSCLCFDSIYVTPAGDFKLGNYSLLVNLGKDSGSSTSLDDKQYYQKYESYVCPSAYRSPERVNSDYDFIFNSLPTHAIDSYSLGVLIEDLYEGTVPEKLIKAVARLKAQSPMQRPRLSPLLKCPVLDTPHCKSMEFLDEIAVKPVEEKISFYQSVPDQLVRGYVSQDAAKHKLLPSMMMSLKSITANPQSVTQDITRREVLAIIPPLFSICDMLDESSFQSQISPFIVTLFHLNDRGIRAALLNRLPSLTERLDKQAINSCVFEPMCTGFTDSSAALREMTLKSTLPLISRLNSVNIEKLGRYLIRLQSDGEDSIRTNTVIFISKVRTIFNYLFAFPV
jgi:SCY1-like protein 1